MAGERSRKASSGEMEEKGDKLIHTRKTTAPQRESEGAVGTGQGKRRGNRFVDHFSKSLMAPSTYF